MIMVVIGQVIHDIRGTHEALALAINHILEAFYIKGVTADMFQNAVIETIVPAAIHRPVCIRDAGGFRNVFGNAVKRLHASRLFGFLNNPVHEIVVSNLSRRVEANAVDVILFNPKAYLVTHKLTRWESIQVFVVEFVVKLWSPVIIRVTRS